MDGRNKRHVPGLARRLATRVVTTSSSTSKPPCLLALRSHTNFILGTVCLAIFTDIFLYGLIVPVIPYSLTTQAGVPEDQVQQWTAILLACYSVALFVGSPLAGTYADQTSSRRVPLLAGLLALAGSTLMLCLGRHVGLLAVGRVLQGLSAAVVWSVGLALLADTVGRKDIGMSMGWVNIAMSGGLLVSPLIGGVVYGGAGYYAVFYVAFGLIFLDIVLRLLLIEKGEARKWDVMDLRGADTSAEEKKPDLKNPSDGPMLGNEQRENLRRGALGGPLSPPGSDGAPYTDTPAVVSARQPYIELIKSHRMLAALAGVVMQAAVMFAFDTVLPLFVKGTFHWDSTAAGLIFFAVFIPGFASPLVGWFSDRYGARWPSFAGFAVSVPLLVCMRFVSDDSIGHKVLLAALLAMLGFTLTLSNTPLMAEITYAIEDEEAARPGIWGDKGVFGAGYGLFTTAFALGGTVGSLMAGYVVAGPGWGTFTWAISLWCVAGAVVVLLWVGGRRQGNQS